MRSASSKRRMIMLRPDLEELPVFGLPPGISLRWYQPGDERCWLAIQRAADRANEISMGLFRERFGADARVLGQRQCFLVGSRGEALGTATAWFDDGFQGASYGRVHYVAVVPEQQGRGLGRSLMTVVCRRLRELGHERAYLATSLWRIRAIRLYQRFGFQPLVRDGEEAALWADFIP